MSVDQRASYVSWPKCSWCFLANEQLISFNQWEADAIDIIWPMSSWRHFANEQLTSVGQWAADFRWPMSSWFQMANDQLTSVWNCYMEKFHHFIKTCTDRPTDMCNPTDAIASKKNWCPRLMGYNCIIVIFCDSRTLNNSQQHTTKCTESLAVEEVSN